MRIETPLMNTVELFHSVKEACEAGTFVEASGEVPAHYLLQDGRRIDAKTYDHAVGQVKWIVMRDTPFTRPKCKTWQEAEQIVGDCPKSDLFEVNNGNHFYYTADGVKYDADDIEALREYVMKERIKAELKAEISGGGVKANQQKASEWKDRMAALYWEAIDQGEDHNDAVEIAITRHKAIAKQNESLRHPSMATAVKFMTWPNLQKYEPDSD